MPEAAPKGRLLLVEDHEDTLRVLGRLITRLGFEVVTARRVAEATAQAASGDVKLVICDLGLPDGSGLELMRELRDRFGLPGIALTGYAGDDYVDQCRAAGFIAHLAKPIDFNELEQTLERVLKSGA